MTFNVSSSIVLHPSVKVQSRGGDIWFSYPGTSAGFLATCVGCEHEGPDCGAIINAWNACEAPCAEQKSGS